MDINIRSTSNGFLVTHIECPLEQGTQHVFETAEGLAGHVKEYAAEFLMRQILEEKE